MTLKSSLRKLKDLFWDYNWNSVSENLNSPFVIARVLEIGNPEQVKILISEIGDDTIKNFLKDDGKRLLSSISYNFWKSYYDEKSIKTTQKGHK